MIAPCAAPPLRNSLWKEAEMKPKVTIAAATLAALAAFAGRAAAQDAGDPAAGQRTFAICRACHQIGPGAKNSVGPVLNGVVGRKAGTVEGYNYSDANKNSGLTWDQATLAEYLKNPRAKLPGTKMTFAGLSREQDIENVIAFLTQYDASGNKVQ
jgi:cytochrome c